MAAGEDSSKRGKAAASTADAADQELLVIAVELTWFLLGAVGPTTPIGVVIEIIMAVADEASATSTPSPDGQCAVAAPPAATAAPPPATLAASPVPSIPATATTQDTSRALADAYATVGHDLATAVRMAATLDRIILADHAGAAAQLLPVRGQLAADINHLFIASRRLTAMPSVGPSQSPAVFVHSPHDQAIDTLPMPYRAVANQPVVVATGRLVSAATVASSPAADRYRDTAAHDAYDT